jgi:hypothetical protein
MQPQQTKVAVLTNRQLKESNTVLDTYLSKLKNGEIYDHS